jgi:hypothetical protein
MPIKSIKPNASIGIGIGSSRLLWLFPKMKDKKSNSTSKQIFN